MPAPCAGCRCRDGADGEPEVTHGFTFCTRIKFAAVVAAIDEVGFEASPYPVCLSLEMHCCAEQQGSIALQLRTLGERLLLPPAAEVDDDWSPPDPLPSPEALKFKARPPPRSAAL
jgi:hypothetical protein